jgi:hypothetical protein
LASLGASIRRESLLPAGPLTDQMLILWSLTSRVNPAVARPVEAFLTALTTRQMVAVDELDAVCAEIEAALGRASGGFAQPR